MGLGFEVADGDGDVVAVLEFGVVESGSGAFDHFVCRRVEELDHVTGGIWNAVETKLEKD